MAKKPNNDTSFWICAILLMMMGLAPIGVGMIIWKLFFDKKHAASMSAGHSKASLGARTTLGAQTQAQVEQSARQEALLRPLEKKAKHRITRGGILTALFTFCFISSLPDALSYLPHTPLEFLDEILIFLCCSVGSGAYLLSGLLQRNQLRRFRTYLAMMSRKSSISIAEVQAATQESAKKIRSDFSDLLDLGMFPGGYLNHGTNQLILAGNGVPESPVRPASSPTKQQSESSYSSAEVLSELRALHDTIQNETMTKQVDRIGTITAQILAFQASHPDRAAQLHRFLSYYLPTTLKILRAYRQLESQTVRGENISSAMERIEGMMNKVVEGFETQLDQLFLGDTMDIASEITVLEQMLAKDGLSGQGITLEL